MPLVPILILAAGQGSRLGRIKALAPWGDGTLLDDAVGRAREVSATVCVAVGAGESLVRSRVRQTPAYWCTVPRWREGQSRSLQAGLGFLSWRCRWPGVMVMLVDQPLVPARHLEALATEAERAPHRAVGTLASGRCMAPAYLPRRLWSSVSRLDGDRGAGGILAAIGARGVACPEAALDIDTRTDLVAARRRLLGA